jgi:hypothetical protein
MLGLVGLLTRAAPRNSVRSLGPQPKSVVVVKESGTGNPATEAPAAEAAATEEEAEIEEIICPKEEKVAPQCVHVARK